MDLITGVLQGVDRTIGRDKGFMLGIKNSPFIKGITDAAGIVVELSARKCPTRGGSAARHLGAEGYCQCDQRFKEFSGIKLDMLNPWWRKISDQPDCTLPSYFCWMKVCLKKLVERDLYVQYSYCSRYWIWNRDAEHWQDKEVILTKIPTHSAGGTDLQAFQLLKIATKKEKITYDSKMIDFELSVNVTTPGEATVTIPDLQPGASVLVDVYSYDLEVV